MRGCSEWMGRVGLGVLFLSGMLASAGAEPPGLLPENRDGFETGDWRRFRPHYTGDAEGWVRPRFRINREARHRRQLEMGLLEEEGFPLSDPTHREWDELDEAERADQARRMEVYAAMIDRLDQNIGRLLGDLRRRGELEDTLILFASDNGASVVTDVSPTPTGQRPRPL